jgi:ElaB/YqjD/DUF883 family membrane-anchored ribosome-binding protein
MNTTTMKNGSEKLMEDLQAVVTDTEALLRTSVADGSEVAGRARMQAEESLRRARARLLEIEQRLAARARGAAKSTDTYVHENPWPAIGVAAGIGFFAGLLLSRR